MHKRTSHKANKICLNNFEHLYDLLELKNIKKIKTNS